MLLLDFFCRYIKDLIIITKISKQENYILKQLFLFNKRNFNLTESQNSDIINDINITNIIRMKVILIIYTLVELLFILFNDIPYLLNKSSNIVWSDSRYLILHILLLLVSIIGFISIKVSLKYDFNKFNVTYNWVVPILAILLLSLIAIVNGLDEIKSGYISSVFIANLIIFSSTLIFKFPLNLALYSIPFATYMGGLALFQNNKQLLMANSINGFIFFLASIVISTIIYNYHYDSITKNIVLKETNLKLNYLSFHDPLTGLLNRRSFGTQVEEKIKIVNETKELAALILIDIDHFKNINDQYGHPVGDLVLQEVSHVFMKYIKTSDLATRWGGEEFIIFAVRTSLDEIYELSENIRSAIQNTQIHADKTKIQITVSLGVSILNNNFLNSFSTSYKTADEALYQAKNQGRNQVVIT